MKFNEVTIPEDSDFAVFRRLCDDNVDWELALGKKNIRVWTKSTSETGFKMIKVSSGCLFWCFVVFRCAYVVLSLITS